MHRPHAAPALRTPTTTGLGARRIQLAAWLFVAWLAACSRTGTGDVPVVVEEPAPSLVADEGAPLVEGSADLELESELAEEPIEEPELLPVEVASASFPIGTTGGRIAAGGLAVEIPARALPETEVIEVGVVDGAEALEHPLPPFAVLGAYRTSPWNPGLTRAARVEAPLRRELEPGTALELLAWQPAMRAYLVVGFADVDASGRAATFSVRQLGDLVVRARPVRAETADVACAHPRMALHDEWPGGAEAEVVGLVEPDSRYERGLAFNLLTDYRLSPQFALVDFKNEEVNDLGATRANELDHQDEDYLMDPNAAAAVAALAALVDAEWRDPISGRPAQRVRITESYDSLIEHSPYSTHYQGRAIDLTLSPIPAAAGEERRAWYGRLSSLAVCAGFDYVLFENQFHVHASVVPTEMAFVTAQGGAGYGVVTSEMPSARRHRQTSHRWMEPGVAITDFRWEGRDRFSLRTRAGGADRVVELGSSPSDGGTALAAWDPEPEPGAVSVDGMRRLVVVGGQAYLANTAPLPPLGTRNADGTPVDVEYPYPVSTLDIDVLAASFREHARTRRAVERHVLTR